jgi:hypothetical protein
VSEIGDDSIRIAFGKAGVLNHYPNLFQTENPLLLEKVLWSVTNIAQTSIIRKAMNIKGVSAALIELFVHTEKKDKRQVLQPLINLLLDGMTTLFSILAS